MFLTLGRKIVYKEKVTIQSSPMDTNFLKLAAIFLVILAAGCTQAPSGTSQVSAPGETAAYASDLYTLDRPASWEVEENGAFVYFKSPLDADSNDLQENVVIYVTPLGDAGQDLVHFFQDSVEILMATTPEFTLVSHGEDKFGNVPAYRIVYTEGNGDAKTKYLQVFAVEGGNSYIVTYTAPAETFDKYLPDAEAIISSYGIK